jgi:hypothetical protein
MITKTNTPKKIEEQRFEFLLYINDNIICQRYFNIRDYNEDSVKSLKLKELMDTLTGVSNDILGELGVIPNHLKNKTIDYLWNTYNPYYVQTEENSKNFSDKIDDFQFEIRVDKSVVAKSQFSGNLFPPKVRYAVDIKEIIPSIISEIRYYLSQKKYQKV